MFTTTVEVQHPSDVSDDMLVCKVCLDHYNSSDQQPRALHCNHTFCERCIHEHLLQLHRKKVVCPLCRTRTRFNGPQNTDVHCLPVNVTAVSLAKQLGHQRNKITDFQASDEGHPLGVHKVVARNVSRLHPPPNGESNFEDWSPTAAAAAAAADQKVVDSSPHQVGDGTNARFEPSRATSTDLTFGQMRQQMANNADVTMGQERHAVVTMTTRHAQLPAAAPIGSKSQQKPSAVYLGCFGMYYHNTASGGQARHPGAFLSPSNVAVLSPIQAARGERGRLVVVDKTSSAVQLFADNGDFLSAINVDGAQAACFVVPADGSDIIERHRIAIATDRGISLFDQRGRLEKAIPLVAAADVVTALAGCQSGFVAAHATRLTVCNRLTPTVAMSTIGSLVRRQSNRVSAVVQFRSIADVAVYVSRYRDARNASAGSGCGGNETLIYVLDTINAAVYVVDPQTSGLRSVVRLQHDDVIDHALVPTGGALSSPRPVSIAVDPTSGHVIVSDSEKRQISAYQWSSGEDESGTDCGPVRLLVQLGATMSAMENCGHVTVSTGRLLYVVVSGSGAAQIRIYRI